MSILYFDIETIPVQDSMLAEELYSSMAGELQEAMASVKAPSNYKDESKIAEYIEKQRGELLSAHAAKLEDAFLKTSFDGGMGQICVIGWSVDDGPEHAYRAEDLSRASERKVIEDFFCAVVNAGPGLCYVGHNVISFDLRFIWQRCIVLGIKPPMFFPRDPKPWGSDVQDTMLLWNKDQRAGGSMDRICKILGIPGKGGISGAHVWPMVKEGRIAEVADYCCGDVRRTREMFKRMTFTA